MFLNNSLNTRLGPFITDADSCASIADIILSYICGHQRARANGQYVCDALNCVASLTTSMEKPVDLLLRYIISIITTTEYFSRLSQLCALLNDRETRVALCATLSSLNRHKCVAGTPLSFVLTAIEDVRLSFVLLLLYINILS
jgi:hypothetical protein